MNSSIGINSILPVPSIDFGFNSTASIDLSVNQANEIFRGIRKMGGAMERKVLGALTTCNRAPRKILTSTGEKCGLDFKL
jgi:hypothetical protein